MNDMQFYNLVSKKRQIIVDIARDLDINLEELGDENLQHVTEETMFILQDLHTMCETDEQRVNYLITLLVAAMLNDCQNNLEGE